MTTTAELERRLAAAERKLQEFEQAGVVKKAALLDDVILVKITDRHGEIGNYTIQNARRAQARLSIGEWHLLSRSEFGDAVEQTKSNLKNNPSRSYSIEVRYGQDVTISTASFA
ncbi:MAG: hypothetical protein KME07_06400 [Pegethrix bostrychoides GSE-TBD4-15B]|jgi:hypothetical protein|uniref:Uncharacterized protein n=1 Tax=Pegethrix bostrychoides GSE-TBD4-15B TaxID=2839662 RepID=A0A951P9K1_9CYAN|nr:hypothetical protein [Pegethrix bostrychoides GSE-TBD4-15B]